MKQPSSHPRRIYRIGGMAALFTVAVAFGEGAVNFLPGGSAPVETVVDWFVQLQTHWFIGLRNLGLLNILMVTLGIPLYLALYTAHRKTDRDLAALATVTSLVAGAVFFATNRAFSMLDLSRQYAQATTEAQRAVLEAAGRATLAVGRSHSPGTFVGFFLGDLAGITMSLVMLRGQRFSKGTALAGIAGFSLLLIYEVWISFVPALREAAMMVAMGGLLANLAWMFSLGLRFFQLEKACLTSASEVQYDPQPAPKSKSGCGGL